MSKTMSKTKVQSSKRNRGNRVYNSRNQARRSGVTISIPRCPTCGKVWSSTRSEAEFRYNDISLRNSHFNAVRYYQAHGGWHWTSQV